MDGGYIYNFEHHRSHALTGAQEEALKRLGLGSARIEVSGKERVPHACYADLKPEEARRTGEELATLGIEVFHP